MTTVAALLRIFSHRLFFISILLCYALFLGSGDNSATRKNEKLLQAVLPISTNQFSEGQLTIVGTVDGNIHAIDENLLHIWTSSTGGPLARGTSIPSSTGKEKSEYIIPSLDGTLLVHNKAEGMRKTSITARILAEKTPFVSGEGVAFSGSKEDRIIGVDLSSGNALFERPDAVIKLKSKKRSVPLFFGREDFLIRGIDTSTGSEKFNFSYSEIFPLSEKAHLNLKSNNDPHNLDIINEGFNSLLSTPEGYLYFIDSSGSVLNDAFPVMLQSPVVNAFSVLVENGDVAQIERLSVRHSLNHLRNYLKLRKPLPSNSAITVRDVASHSLENIMTGSLVPSGASSSVGSITDGGNMVIVQTALDTTHNSDSFYGIEIILPSTVENTAPIIATDVSKPGLSAALVSSQYRKDTFAGNNIEFAQLDDCEAMLRTEKLEAIAKSGSVVSKTRLKTNIRQKVLFPGSSSSAQGSAVSDEGENIRDHCLQGRQSRSFWASPEEYFATIDKPITQQADKSSSIEGNAVGHVRGLHKLMNVEPDADFWLPKIQKKLQHQALAEERYRVGHSLEMLHRNKPSVYQSLTELQLYRIYLILQTIASFMLIVLLILLAMVIAYVIQFPQPKKLSDQPQLAQLLIPYIWAHYPVARPILSIFFEDLGTVTTNATVSNGPLPPLSPGAVSEIVDEAGRRVLKVGALRVYDSVLGMGSNGTVVFVGTFNGRPVAVKRMLAMFHSSAEREMSLLIRSDGHPNVVRYFIKEECNDFIYLGLQLCVMSLKDFVLHLRRNVVLQVAKRNCIDVRAIGNILDDPYGCLLAFDNVLASGIGDTIARSGKSNKSSIVDEDSPTGSWADGISDEVRTSMLQIAQGLSILHAQRIIHRDIKPHNILCAPPNEHVLHREDALSGDFRNQYFCEMNEFDDDDCTIEAQEKKKKNKPLLSLTQLSEFVLKISDMGLSKQLLDIGDASFSRKALSLSILQQHYRRQYNQQGKKDNSLEDNAIDSTDSVNSNRTVEMADHVGTIGWQAPEVIAHHRTTKTEAVQPTTNSNDSAEQLKSDVFSLGCVFYYILSLGGHPFGAWYEREHNIAHGRYNLSLFESSFPDLVHLLSVMLEKDAALRPTALQITSHAFFWNATQRLEFLTDMSDVVEKLPADHIAVLALEAQQTAIFRSSWDRVLNVSLLQDMGRFRRYDPRSVRDLLRLIRNKKHHYMELPLALRETMGSMPQGYVRYFEKRFPRLLLHCLQVASQHLQNDNLLVRWLQNTTIYSKQVSAGEVSESIDPIAEALNETSIVVEEDEWTKLDNSLLNETDNEANAAAASASEVHMNEILDDSSNISNAIGESVRPIIGTVAVDLQRLVSQGVIVWRNSALENSLPVSSRRGWLRDAADWTSTPSPPFQAPHSQRNRPAHLMRQSTDAKYRTRLCSHWELSNAGLCPMRKKGKCTFAHSPLELRVKETRRNKWPRLEKVPNATGAGDARETNNQVSGGEDVLTTARAADPSILALYQMISATDEASVGSVQPASQLSHTALSFTPAAAAYGQTSAPQSSQYFPSSYAPPSLSLPRSLPVHSAVYPHNMPYPHASSYFPPQQGVYATALQEHGFDPNYHGYMPASDYYYDTNRRPNEYHPTNPSDAAQTQVEYPQTFKENY